MTTSAISIADRLRQPAPNAPLVILLALLMPGYHVIAVINRDRPMFTPELPLDRAIPVEPAWMLAYGSVWIFALLPVFVVRSPVLMRRALLAAVTVFALAYAGFLAYPTVLPRPQIVEGGFLAKSLQINYSLDPPYNCFPSLHVAWAFVSALTGYRVHRGVGLAALVWAGLISLSTLYTKQHYVLDVVGGMAIAGVAYLLFLRSVPRHATTELDRRLAPQRAFQLAGFYAAVVMLSVVLSMIRA